jgi:putative exosortase-associated protein (TIGR04073 family)
MPRRFAMKKAILLTTLFSFLFSFTLHAADVWEMANSDDYGDRAGGMLGRGLINVVTSPVDIPAQVARGAREGDPAVLGAVGGIASGAACTILRAASGIVDVAFFLVPEFHGVPVSRNYANCLDFSQAGSQVAAAVSKPARAYSPPPAPKVVRQAAPKTSSIKGYEPPPSSSDGQMKYVKK